MLKSKKITAIVGAAALVSMLSVCAFAAETVKIVPLSQLTASIEAIPATKVVKATPLSDVVKMTKIALPETDEAAVGEMTESIPATALTPAMTIK